eukprot:scaffold2229_cov262-Pinguiococcus_pyrenoidosus.AAC.1
MQELSSKKPFPAELSLAAPEPQEVHDRVEILPNERFPEGGVSVFVWCGPQSGRSFVRKHGERLVRGGKEGLPEVCIKQRHHAPKHGGVKRTRPVPDHLHSIQSAAPHIHALVRTQAEEASVEAPNIARVLFELRVDLGFVAGIRIVPIRLDRFLVVIALPLLRHRRKRLKYMTQGLRHQLREPSLPISQGEAGLVEG